MGNTVIGTAINESPTISIAAAAAIEGARCTAVVLGEGGVQHPTAGANVFGLIVPSVDENVAKDARVDVQIKDIGMWKAGEALKQGDILATDADGCAVKATAGAHIVAVAIKDSAAGSYASVQITKAGKMA